MTDEDMNAYMAEAGLTGDASASANHQGTKRKAKHDDEGIKKAKVVEQKEPENRGIWVTNLPRDTDVDEVEEEFKKYGIIDQGADGNKRIKLYRDDEGNLTGEALIVYFRKESINLAIQMMDDYWFRATDQSQGKITVREADRSYKHNKGTEEIVSKLTRKDKKASERNRADLNRKLADWSDNEDEVAEMYAPKKNKWAKCVILKNVFKLQELEEDKAAYLEIKEDVRDEAMKHGEVTNVTLYDKEPAGIVTVRFREFDSASAFCKASHGRAFGGVKLVATLAEDRPKFKKSQRGEPEPKDEDEEEDWYEKATKEDALKRAAGEQKV